MKNILFYSSVKDKALFQTQKFYVIDINILEDLGYHVVLSNSIFDALKFWKYSFVFAYFYRYSFFVALIAKCFGKSTYFTGGIDDLEVSRTSRKAYLIQKWFMRLCYWVSKSCIIVSKTDNSNVKKVLGKKTYKKLSYSEHAIDVKRFITNSDPQKHLFTTVVWMGGVTNVVRKGVDKALRLFSILKQDDEYSDSRFIIMGKEGDGTPFLKTLVQNLGLSDSVVFTNEVSEEEKIQILKKSQYYFQLSEYEGFGLAALEALAADNIVIHSGKGGLANPIFKEGGILFDIESDVEKEALKLREKLQSYKRSQLLNNELQLKYDILRRKNDFKEIMKAE